MNPPAKFSDFYRYCVNVKHNAYEINEIGYRNNNHILSQDRYAQLQRLQKLIRRLQTRLKKERQLQNEYKSCLTVLAKQQNVKQIKKLILNLDDLDRQVKAFTNRDLKSICIRILWSKTLTFYIYIANRKKMMIQSNIKISDISIGQLAISDHGNKKFTTCVLYHQALSVLPAFVLNNISEHQCEFEEKNEHFITIRKLKAKRIYHSDRSELAIIVFDESKNVLQLIRSLMLSEYKVEQASIQSNRELRLHGYHIQYSIINRSKYVTSSKKVYACELRYCVDFDIHFMCDFSIEGMVGGAITFEEETWIGVCIGETGSFCSGILFTAEIVQQMLDMVNQPQENKVPSQQRLFSEMEVEEYCSDQMFTFQEDYIFFLQEFSQIDRFSIKGNE